MVRVISKLTENSGMDFHEEINKNNLKKSDQKIKVCFKGDVPTIAPYRLKIYQISLKHYYITKKELLKLKEK